MSTHTQPLQTNPWMVQMARIVSIEHNIEQVQTYGLELVEDQSVSPVRFRAGQFNMLYVPGCGEVAISMSGAPGQLPLLHTIRTVGRVTEAIAAMSLGDQIGIRGPYGTAWPIDACEGHDVIFIAGGIGLAPLRPAIYELLSHRQRLGKLTLLLGARSPELLLYADEFESWSNQGLQVIATVDRVCDHWNGHVGLVPDLLDNLPGIRPNNTMVLTCGPEIMMHYSAQSALKRGIPATAIWVSLERHMQCAIGLCGHCQLGPVFVCKDGPVLSYDRAEPLMHVKEW